MAVIKTETVMAEGFTLSRLIFRLLKRQPEGYIEQVMTENPGLAALGPTLPVGTVIRFPLDKIPSAQEAPNVVRLWD